ncbi:phage tail assembly chaperone G [Halobacillus aidingensis]|uniref:Uncharacterized protein n=1 Tax=Halobacillus aidingensis TaxID=240303 RepID=A0A1H0MFL7_HALAD|nr:hypothetical protein [Halobacillus aidingensis]SDO79194.1 hypothetical protein SAMN05421677_10821 [Halobacillus aidingensis]
MQIELLIDGKKKIFTAPFVPMLAKRKWLEFEADESLDLDNPTPEQFDEIATVIQKIVFREQFTLEELYWGIPYEQMVKKTFEAVYGFKSSEGTDDDQGNVTREER